VVGIAVCTAAMVILLSAFNGIEGMISKLYTSFDAPITIQHQTRKTFFLREIDLGQLQKLRGVSCFSKELEELVVLRKNQRWMNANMHAVDPVFVRQARVSSHLINGVGTPHLNQESHVFLGADIFSKLRLGLGSSDNNIQLYVPKRGLRMQLGKTPFFIRQIQVAGAMNFNQELNGSALLWNYAAAAQFFNQQGAVTRLHVYPKQNINLDDLRTEIKALVGPRFLVRTQLEKNALIYKTSRSERLVVFIILLFVFILASFNLIATLTMLIHEKQGNLQVLKALGMTAQNRFQIFFFEGLLLSSIGVLIGVVLGLLVCWTQQYFGWLIVPGANVPFPIVFKWQDFASILLAASVLSFLFTYFPVRFLLRKASFV
jgi:lipoprotein-releasing system permease protein